jgi:hypothetical protein
MMPKEVKTFKIKLEIKRIYFIGDGKHGEAVTMLFFNGVMFIKISFDQVK